MALYLPDGDYSALSGSILVLGLVREAAKTVVFRLVTTGLLFHRQIPVDEGAAGEAVQLMAARLQLAVSLIIYRSILAKYHLALAVAADGLT